VDDDMTMRVPSEAVFAEMARASSTPFHGRVFLPEEDDNTCNVQLVFKKPEPIPVPATVEPISENYERQLPPPPPLSPIMETSRENWKSSSSR
jgi:hypothetical protein